MTAIILMTKTMFIAELAPLPPETIARARQALTDLTAMQAATALLMMAGYSDSRIAETLGCAVKTVAVHTSAVLTKCGCKRIELARMGGIEFAGDQAIEQWLRAGLAAVKLRRQSPSGTTG